MMTFEDLELFWALAERQNITEAARLSRMSQPTASRRLKALEAELGAFLVDRSTYPLSLTPYGFLFLEFTDEVLQKFRALKLNAGANHSLLGTLTVATSSSPAARLVSHWMADFVKANPGIRPRLEAMNSQAVVDHVLSDQSMLGFVGILPRHPHLTAIPVGEDEIVLLVPRQSPYTNLTRPAPWDQIHTLPFITRTQGSGTEDTVWRALKDHGWSLPSHVVFEVDTGSALIDAVESGLGAGFVSRELLFRRELTKCTPWPVKDLTIVRPLYLIFSPDRIRSVPSARAFLRYASLRLPKSFEPDQKKEVSP